MVSKKDFGDLQAILVQNDDPERKFVQKVDSHDSIATGQSDAKALFDRIGHEPPFTVLGSGCSKQT